MSLNTPLSRARGLGSAKHGLHHWIAQRISAVALLFLVVWFVSALLSAVSQDKDIIELVAHPLHAVAFVLFLGTALYHGALGVQVVIEDYVHCECGKTFLLLAVKFVAIVTAVAAILAILTFHVSGPQKGKFGPAYGGKPCASAQKKPGCHKGEHRKKPCEKDGKPCKGKEPCMKDGKPCRGEKGENVAPEAALEDKAGEAVIQQAPAMDEQQAESAETAN